MFEFAFLLAAGFFALPFYWMIGLGVLFFIDVALTESDNAGWAAVSLLAGVFIAAWLGAGVNPFVFTWSHLADIVSFFIVYFIIGAGWSVIRWYRYLIKVRNRLRKTKDSYYRSEAMVSNNKSRITGWITLWPFSVVGTFCGDFIVRLASNIYDALSTVYERLEQHVMGEFDQAEESE
jgi:hypothetical protein